MDKEFEKLKKESNKLKKEIDNILKEYLDTIDDNYSDIWEKINLLIENEIEQEKFCNQ